MHAERIGKRKHVCVCECARASCLCHRGRALKLRSRCTRLELRQPFALFRSLIRGRWQHALRELQRWDSFVAWVKIAVITAFAYRCHGLNTISVAASYPVGRSRPFSRRLGPAAVLRGSCSHAIAAIACRYPGSNPVAAVVSCVAFFRPGT